VTALHKEQDYSHHTWDAVTSYCQYLDR
jgi:hypothetical protein